MCRNPNLSSGFPLGLHCPWCNEDRAVQLYDFSDSLLKCQPAVLVKGMKRKGLHGSRHSQATQGVCASRGRWSQYLLNGYDCTGTCSAVSLELIKEKKSNSNFTVISISISHKLTLNWNWYGHVGHMPSQLQQIYCHFITWKYWNVKFAWGVSIHSGYLTRYIWLPPNQTFPQKE